MAMFIHITLLLILQSCTSLDQEPLLVIGKKGHDAAFYFPARMSKEQEIFSQEPDNYSGEHGSYLEEPENYSGEPANRSKDQEMYSFYRSTENETTPMMSIKGNGHSAHSQRVSFTFSTSKALAFRVSDVSLDDGGIYKVVEWMSAERLVRTLSYHMAVCPKVSHLVFMSSSLNETVGVDIYDFDPSQGDMLEVYQPGQELLSDFHDLTVGTDACSQIFPGDQVSGPQVSQNGSSVWLSSKWSDGESYYIIIWKGKECQEIIKLEIGMELPLVINRIVVHGAGSEGLRPVSLAWHMAWPGMKMAIPCGTDVWNMAKVEWKTPKHLKCDASVAITNIGAVTHDKAMYIEDGDNSLVIPSVTSDHQGTYTCHAGDDTTDHKLTVCLDQGLTYVSFSLNASIALSCHPGLKAMTKDISSVLSGTTEWYSLRGQEIDVLFRRGQFGSAVPEDLRAKLEVSDDSNSLHIFNLLPVDSGIYRCLQDCNSAPCFSRAFHLVYRDPFGIGSPFYRVYASLLGTGLLLMICAVVCSNLRLRYGREYSKGKGKPADEEGGERREEG